MRVALAIGLAGLKELDALRQQKLISEEEYQAVLRRP